MRKIVALTLTFALLFSFAACRKEKNHVPDSTTASSVFSQTLTESETSETIAETSSTEKSPVPQIVSPNTKISKTIVEESTVVENITAVISTEIKKTRVSTTRCDYFPNRTSTTQEETTTELTETSTTRRRRTTTEESRTEEVSHHHESPAPTKIVAKSACTLTISCILLLDNKDTLKNGKEAFVPVNGYILETVEIEFISGETVFDVLKRACAENFCSDNCKYCQNGGIQLEYEFTPGYDNYYVEGIHQIYEKDCGSKSGWMYKVNNVFPNYGCSDYVVKNGDNIEFVYTLNLGEDIGAEL